jgi:hypothetical protein
VAQLSDACPGMLQHNLPLVSQEGLCIACRGGNKCWNGLLPQLSKPIQTLYPSNLVFLHRQDVAELQRVVLNTCTTLWVRQCRAVISIDVSQHNTSKYSFSVQGTLLATRSG